MATRAFNLTAQLTVQGPKNLATIVNQLRSQLGSINTQVNVQISAGSVRNTATLNSNLQSLNRTLTQTAAILPGVNAQLVQLATNLGNVKANNVNLGGMNNALNNTGKAASKAASAAESFGRASGSALKSVLSFSAGTSIVVGLGAAFSKAVGEAITFDKEMVRLVQVSGKSLKSLSGVEKEITRLSKGLGVSSTELLNVATTFNQAGLSIKETEIALEALAKSSLAPSFDDMTKTTEGVIAAMTQFSLKAKDFEGVLGSINAVSAAFAVEADDIITAISRAGAAFAASSKGVGTARDNFNEFIAVFTSVRATTRESAESIATGLRTIFTRFQRSQTVDALKEYGVALTDLEGKFVGPYKAVENLSAVLNTLDPRDLRFAKIVEELGGYRQIGKVIPLIQQFATAQDALRVAQEGTGSLNEDAIVAQQSISNALNKTKESFLALVRELANTTSFRTFVDTVLRLTNGILGLASAFKELIPVLGIIAAVKIGSGISGFAKGFGKGLRGPSRFAKGGMVHHFAEGGVVPGPNIKKDIVQANLMPGEFVVRRDAAEAYGYDNLHALNSGNMNYAAEGGRQQRRLVDSKDSALALQFGKKSAIGKALYGEKGSLAGSTFKVGRNPSAEDYGIVFLRPYDEDFSFTGSMPGGYKYNILASGLEQKFAGQLEETLRKRTISAIKIGSKAIGKQLQIPVGDSFPEDTLLKQIGFDNALGRIFEGMLTVTGGGPFRDNPSENFDFSSGLPTNLVPAFPLLSNIKNIDAKATFNTDALGGKSGVINKIKKNITVPKKMARGGRASGIRSLIMPGEFVFNRQAARRIGSKRLNEINNADRKAPQRFARGGAVGGVVRRAVGGYIPNAAQAQSTIQSIQNKAIASGTPLTNKEINILRRNILKAADEMAKIASSSAQVDKGYRVYLNDIRKGKSHQDALNRAMDRVTKEFYKAGGSFSFLNNKMPRLAGALGKLESKIGGRGIGLTGLLATTQLTSSLIGDKTPGAAAASSGINSAVTGAFIGGEIGAIFGPVGSAVGAVAGGLISGLTSMVSAFKEAKVREALDGLTNSSKAAEEALNNLSTGKNIKGEQFDKIFDRTANKSFINAQLSASRTNDFALEGLSSDGRKNKFARERDAYIQSVISGREGQIKVARSVTEQRARDFNLRGRLSIPAQQGELQKAYSKEELSNITFLRDAILGSGNKNLINDIGNADKLRYSGAINTLEYQKRVLEIFGAAQAEISKRVDLESKLNDAMINSVQTIQLLVQSYSKFGAEAQRASEEFNKAIDINFANLDFTQGNATFGLNNKFINPLTNLEAYSQDEIKSQFTNLRGGIGGISNTGVFSSLEKSALAVKKAEEELPGLIAAAAEANQAGGDSGPFEALKDKILKTIPDKEIAEGIIGKLEKSFKQDQEGGAIALRQAAENEIKENLGKVGEATKKASEQLFNSIANIFNAVQDKIKQLVQFDSIIQKAETDIATFNADVQTRRSELFGKKPTLRDAEQQSRSIRAATLGNSLGAFADATPGQIGEQIRKRVSRGRELEAQQINANNPDATRNREEAILQNNIEINRLTATLQQQQNIERELTAVINELAAIEEERQKQNLSAEDLFTATPKELAELNRNLNNYQVILGGNQAEIKKLRPEDIKSALEAGRKFEFNDDTANANAEIIRRNLRETLDPVLRGLFDKAFPLFNQKKGENPQEQQKIKDFDRLNLQAAQARQEALNLQKTSFTNSLRELTVEIDKAITKIREAANRPIQNVPAGGQARVPANLRGGPGPILAQQLDLPNPNAGVISPRVAAFRAEQARIAKLQKNRKEAERAANIRANERRNFKTNILPGQTAEAAGGVAAAFGIKNIQPGRDTKAARQYIDNLFESAMASNFAGQATGTLLNNINQRNNSPEAQFQRTINKADTMLRVERTVFGGAAGSFTGAERANRANRTNIFTNSLAGGANAAFDSGQTIQLMKDMGMNIQTWVGSAREFISGFNEGIAKMPIVPSEIQISGTQRIEVIFNGANELLNGPLGTFVTNLVRGEMERRFNQDGSPKTLLPGGVGTG